MDIHESTVFAQGRFMKYGDARVGLLTHGLNYGTGCFEGIRGYWNAGERELYLLQPREHYERLHASAKILLMELRHSLDELVELTVEVCAKNGFEQNVYIRPLLFKGAEEIGVRLHSVTDAFAIIAIPFDKYYDVEAGLNTCISSWRRMDDNSAPARAKVTGVYINSALAKSDAHLNGFDEAIMLNADGHVAEGSAANLFLAKNGVLSTPDVSQNVLEGITRRTVIAVAKNEFGIPVHERQIDRSELYTADELFLTGTAAGISFIRAVDNRAVGDGKKGAIASRLSDFLEAITGGREPAYRSMLTPVYARRRVTA